MLQSLIILHSQNWEKFILLLFRVIPNICDFCGCCVGICPEDAIELRESEIKIIESKCTNCSKCVWSCPIEALKFSEEDVIKSSYK